MNNKIVKGDGSLLQFFLYINILKVYTYFKWIMNLINRIKLKLFHIICKDNILTISLLNDIITFERLGD